MSKITIQKDSTLLVPDVPTVPYITGDGVGTEVTPSMQIIVDAAICRMSWYRHHVQGMLGIGCRRNVRIVFKVCHIGQADRVACLCGKIPIRIVSIITSICLHADRDTPLLLQFIDGANMIEMTMCQQDLFNGQFLFFCHPNQFISFRARIDKECMMRIIIDVKIRIHRDILCHCRL